MWFTPQPEDSPWAKRIDWYLNMQIRRAEKHKNRKIETQLLKTLQDNELAEFKFPASKDSPLLIASQGRLPVDAVVRVPYFGDQKKWFLGLSTVWKGLARPQARIFLPFQVSVDEVKSYWAKDDDHLLSIVPFETTLE